MAVNDIEPEDDRNVQPRFLHRDVLEMIGPLGADHVEHRADAALCNKFVVGEF